MGWQFKHKLGAARLRVLQVEAAAQLTGQQTSPSQQVAKDEQLSRLPHALAQLPPAQQEAIILHHLNGMPLTEIANRLDRSETAIGGLLYRALKKLNEIMSEQQSM